MTIYALSDIYLSFESAMLQVIPVFKKHWLCRERVASQ